MINIDTRMRKILIALLLFINVAIISPAEENYYDYKALLVGDAQGNIIKKENVNAVRPLASITKVMTSILTMDKIREGEISMNDRVVISQVAAAVPYGVKLNAGREYTVRDLLKATIIKSSNNAAYALAEYVSEGNVEKFISSMNSKARKLGLDSLRFCSPHGLPPSYTGSCMDEGNAKDLYGLALHAIEYKEYLDISRNATDYIDYGGIKLNSTNALLGKVGGVDGLKTGYHKAAGSNIILTAQRGEERVIVVILGSERAKNRNAVGAKEIDDYFLNVESRTVSKNNKNKRNGKNIFKEIWNGITSLGNSSSTKEKLPKDMGNGKKKVIGKENAVKTIKIGDEKFSLYPAEDVIISGEAGKKKITYKITLNDNITARHRGKVVGYYSADDGINEFAGSLIMR